MKKLKTIFLLAFAFAIVFAVGTQTKTMAQATTITTQASFPVIYDAVPCGGDVVTFSGNMHFLFHITVTPNGGRHTVLVMNTSDVKGVGLTGEEYIANTTVTQNLNNPETIDGKLVYTSNAKYLVVGKGSNPDFLLRMKMHITANDNGTATPDTPEFTIQCNQ